MSKRESAAGVVNRRRAYFECRYGQLHVRTAFPSTGGFDERVALVCLHETPRSSRTFDAFLPAIATDRSLYACDTPGFGDSDPPPSPPSMVDYAGAIGDFLDALRLREADVLGVGTGAMIAVELAIARARAIRRLVLASLPLDTTALRDAWQQDATPVPPAADGSHLLREWQRSRLVRGSSEPLERFADGFVDELQSAPRAVWAVHASCDWNGPERLPLVAQKTLVLRPRDAQWDTAPRVRTLLRDGTLEELPEQGGGMFALDPVGIASRVRRFLDY